MEELFCIGCGAQIQTTDKDVAGFTPQSALEKGLETGQLYCQRCFRLRHYNEISDVNITDDDFLKLLHSVGESDALVVNVIDIFDFNGFLGEIWHLIRRNFLMDCKKSHRELQIVNNRKASLFWIFWHCLIFPKPR